MANLIDKNAGELFYDNLINDVSMPVVVKSVKLKAGQGLLSRGTVLGINSEGEAVKVNSTATDGSEKADCILTDTTDTTDSVVATAYSAGMFNRQALIVGSESIEVHEKELRSLNILMKDNLS